MCKYFNLNWIIRLFFCFSYNSSKISPKVFTGTFKTLTSVYISAPPIRTLHTSSWPIRTWASLLFWDDGRSRGQSHSLYTRAFLMIVTSSSRSLSESRCETELKENAVKSATSHVWFGQNAWMQSVVNEVPRDVLISDWLFAISSTCLLY